MRPGGVLAVTLLAAVGMGCDIIEPTCVSQREQGLVATLQGQVGAAQIGSHLVDYGTEGSQNDVSLTWTGQATPGGPAIAVYATSAGCTDFQLPASSNTGACAVLGAAGSIDGHIAYTLTVTHGRGNPEILGSPPRFKLWVVGDATRSVTYSMNVTWFRGPDC